MKSLYQSYDWPNAFRKEEFTAARDAYIVQEKEKKWAAERAHQEL
jgi:hypothetical protein